MKKIIPSIKVLCAILTPILGFSSAIYGSGSTGPCLTDRGIPVPPPPVVDGAYFVTPPYPAPQDTWFIDITIFEDNLFFVADFHEWCYDNWVVIFSTDCDEWYGFYAEDQFFYDLAEFGEIAVWDKPYVIDNPVIFSESENEEWRDFVDPIWSFEEMDWVPIETIPTEFCLELEP